MLYRIGRLPDPLGWPPQEFIGGGRFDDPQREFRVLYAGQRMACFLETLAPFRPSVEALAHLRRVGGGLEPAPRAVVPTDWYQKRAVARMRLGRGQRWLDLRAIETREALRGELATTLLELGLADLDLSGVLGPRRRLTQAIARWAYENGYAGLAYRSRFDDALSLWALFDGAAFEPVGVPEPIMPDDPDLIAAAHLFGLSI
ncbi:MAG: RES family NAD+ phosphorylase [Chloroflexi bacterium]|nr:RES family NAD+ phosphorylase [Chloroflexota bacterium]